MDSFTDPNDPLKDPNDNTATLILLTIWGIRQVKRVSWDDIENALDYIPREHFVKVMRRLQECGFIDARPDGYFLYPAGFDVVKQALKHLPPPPLPPKRNPDEDLRTLEHRFHQSKDMHLAARVLAGYRRINRQDEIWRFGQEVLAPYIEAYVTEFSKQGGLNAVQDLREGRLPELLQAKLDLERETKILGYPAGYFCLRPFHHIPYINSHLEELAILHNTTWVYVGRDDDEYFGSAYFKEDPDAEEFMEVVTAQGIFQPGSMFLAHSTTTSVAIVSWAQGR